MAPRNSDDPNGISRRRFVASMAATGCVAVTSSGVLLADGRFVIPNSEGFLVVDTKKCQG